MQNLQYFIDQEELSDDDAETLSTLADNFVSLLEGHYQQMSADASDDFIELMSNLEQIIGLFKSLSVSNKELTYHVARLETYLICSKQRCLKEWIEVEKEKEIERKGKTWFDGDMGCWQIEKANGGFTNCGVYYRNPGGNAEKKNEYLRLDYLGLSTFSIMD